MISGGERRMGETDVEIERKFLVKGAFPEPCKTVKEVSFYLPSGRGEEIRVQNREGACIIEVKRKSSRLSRERTRAEISIETFRTLFELSGGEKMAIRRKLHYFPGKSPTITVREYSGKLKGLVRAEVNFRSETEAKRFRKPAWMGPEITSGALGRNKTLYSMTKGAFLKELESFN